MIKQKGIEGEFVVSSSATSTEEIWNGIGNPVYPPAREELAKHGLRHVWNTSLAEYVWLPIRFDGEMAYVDWKEEWRIEDYE